MKEGIIANSAFQKCFKCAEAKEKLKKLAKKAKNLKNTKAYVRNSPVTVTKCFSAKQGKETEKVFSFCSATHYG